MRRAGTLLTGLLILLAGLMGASVVSAGPAQAQVDPSKWNLTSFCTASESYPESRRFRVRNSTGASVAGVVLRNQNNGQSITFTAPPGDSFQLVPAVAGNPSAANTTQLIVEGVTVATKAANNKACATVAGTAVCNQSTGTYAVTWTVANNDSGSSTITDTSRPVTFTPNPVAANGSATATETVPSPSSGTQVVTLTVTLNLGSSIVSSPSASVTIGACGDPPPVITFTFTKTPDVTTAPVGSTVTYTYAGTNTGNVALEAVQLVDDRLGVVIQDPATTIVEPGEALTRQVTYTVTAGDAAIGSIDNAAVVTVEPTEGPDREPRTAVATATVQVPPVPPEPVVALVGSATCDPDTGEFDVEWTVSNGGPGDAVVTSATRPGLTFAPTPIPEGGTAVATETVPAPSSDVTVVPLTVEVGPAPDNPGPRPPATATTSVTLGRCEPTPPVVAFTFDKKADRTRAAAGDVVTYTYSGVNTGEVPLEVVGLVDDALGVVIVEPEVTVVPPGGTLSRKVRYTVTLEDANIGRKVNNAVVAVRVADDPEAPLLFAIADARVLIDPPSQGPNPPQPVVPPTPPELPATGGSDSAPLSAIALLLLVSGTLLVRSSRRLRP